MSERKKSNEVVHIFDQRAKGEVVKYDNGLAMVKWEGKPAHQLHPCSSSELIFVNQPKSSNE